MKEKAILFDKKGKSKTHLLLDEDELVCGNIKIAAYFSLAIQSLKNTGEYINAANQTA